MMRNQSDAPRLSGSELARAVEEATGFLVDLIRIPTVNPPGNETPAAHYVEKVMSEGGLETRFFEPAPGRGSVVTRLPADGPRDGQNDSGGKGPLLLLAHLDVVPVDEKRWRVPPFDGLVKDGYIWGRGAVDCKNMVAVWMALILAYRRLGGLKRDLIFAATADEEAGGQMGVGWLVEHEFEAIRADACLNEGGGMSIASGPATYFLCNNAEKAPIWLRLTAEGRPGHASMPHPDNAVLKLARALAELTPSRLPVHITPTVRDFVAGLAAGQGFPRSLVIRQMANPALADRLLSAVFPDQEKAAGFRAMIRNTAAPTILSAGLKVNIIPSEATAEVDCRILPGQTADDLVRELRAVIGEGIRIDLDRSATATESPFPGPLGEAVAAALARTHPGARAIPFLVPGATDSRFLRPRGIPSYGFFPTLPKDGFPAAHGHDERLSLESLSFAVRTLAEVIAGYAG